MRDSKKSERKVLSFKALSIVAYIAAAFTAAIASLSLPPRAYAEDTSAAQDLERIQGTWHVVSLHLGGKPMEFPPTQTARSRVWRFKNNKVFYPSETDEEIEATVIIDPKHDPKRLDITPVRGKDVTTIKCVYSLDNGKLRVAVTADVGPGSPEEEARRLKSAKQKRPVRLGAQPGEPILLITMERRHAGKPKE